MSVCKVTIHTWRRTQSHVWWRVSTLFVCTISYNLYYCEIFLLIHKKLYHTHMSQITKTHSDVIDRVKHGNWYNTVRRGFEFRHGINLSHSDVWLTMTWGKFVVTQSWNKWTCLVHSRHENLLWLPCVNFDRPMCSESRPLCPGFRFKGGENVKWD